jgi:hypothetical protein
MCVFSAVAKVAIVFGCGDMKQDFLQAINAAFRFPGLQQPNFADLGGRYSRPLTFLKLSPKIKTGKIQLRRKAGAVSFSPIQHATNEKTCGSQAVGFVRGIAFKLARQIGVSPRPNYSQAGSAEASFWVPFRVVCVFRGSSRFFALRLS